MTVNEFKLLRRLESSFERTLQGLKYLKMSTTHREGRWRGRRHGGAKHRSAEGGRVWGTSMGSGDIAPRKFWNL